eukprot:TRINITY_DN28121_c0_g1_i1.p1 TRINITY_DN28121_c0_g1~~TRINITY_DN28121_c0_g1_i1.p1  ORF type:complete len:320 (+),score=55.57 TRINITY_DN28121_c0_g1_i1:31-990(+)
MTTNKEIVNKMRDQMSHSQDAASDEGSDYTEDEISALVSILDGLTRDQLKVKRVVRMINDATLGAIDSSPFGPLVQEVAKNYTWGGNQFKVVSIDVLTAFNTELKSRLSQVASGTGHEDAIAEEEEVEEDIEELPQQQAQEGSEHPAAAILQTLATQLRQVETEISGIRKDNQSLTEQQQQLRAQAMPKEPAPPVPQPTQHDSRIDAILSLMCDDRSCPMSSSLQTIKNDILKSRKAPDLVPVTTPTLENSDFGIFSSTNPARLPPKESWYTSIKNNAAHYIIVGVVVGIINFRNFMRMIQVIFETTPDSEFIGPIQQT